jgi:hypothetical protein
MSPPEFAELETSIVNRPAWKAGGPNSVLQSQVFRVRAASLCLTDGDPYEIEGAISSADDMAAALALAQDVARVSSQLKISPPTSADLLAEYQPARLTRLAVDYVPVLLVDEESARDRFGLRRDFNDPTLLEGMHPWRRLVRALRAEGWRGGNTTPGPDAGCRPPDNTATLRTRRILEDRMDWPTREAGATHACRVRNRRTARVSGRPQCHRDAPGETPSQSSHAVLATGLTTASHRRSELASLDHRRQ